MKMDGIVIIAIIISRIGRGKLIQLLAPLGEGMKKIFYREKGNKVWTEGYLLEKQNGKVLVGDTQYARGIWYSEDDLEISNRD
jgi:hypothetical protein